MFIVKLVVGILSVITCCKISLNKSNTAKNAYTFFESLRITCENLLCEFSYKKRPIKYALNKNYTSDDYVKFLSNFVKFNKREYPCYLSNDEIVKIDAFFNEIGKSDTDSQKTMILAYKNEFNSIASEKRKRFIKTNDVTMKVGFSVGVMLFIMVI